MNVNSPDLFIKSIGSETGHSEETQKANRKAEYNGKWSSVKFIWKKRGWYSITQCVKQNIYQDKIGY